MLKRHADGQQFIEEILEETLRQGGIAPVDRRLVQELAFGVVRWQGTLDWLISERTQGRQQKPVLQILLRLGLYQIFWLDRIPDHAAVNETVEMARQLGFGPQSGFINAVLRGYLRERSETEKKLEGLKAENPALGYSHPAWLCSRWQQRWSPEQLRKFLAWNNRPPPTFARVNTLKATPEQVVARWEEEKVRFIPQQFDWAPRHIVFELETHPPLHEMPSFREGLFYVQDPSTLLAVTMMKPQAGEAVLDLCSAPGGKTTFSAQLMENRGVIMAQDPHMLRRKLVQENCERLGVTCVQLSAPAEGMNPELSTPYDRVLVDAPCSNTGVLRRRVDLRWRIQEKEIARLAKIQQDLLRNAARQVKTGGVLVYSTCSIEPDENENVVEAILREFPFLRLVEQHSLLPFRDGFDGAYAARIMRDL